MTKNEALDLVRDVGPLPKFPVVQKAEKSYCPCRTKLLLVCEKGIEFHPAYYVCPSCARVVRIKP